MDTDNFAITEARGALPVTLPNHHVYVKTRLKCFSHVDFSYSLVTLKIPVLDLTFYHFSL